ncbi:MAG: LysR substrate-binding domain-containing protein [Kofleriaceae bacterium]
MRPDLFAGILPFVRTAEERSFGKAAASLGITTAAVSKAVKKLEEDLDVKLLDRSSRVVKLTREGEVFLERSRRAVLDVQGAREALAGSRREPRGEVAVTMSIVLASFVVPRLARLGLQYPQLTFRLQITDRIARIADEGVDVAVRMGDLVSSSLVVRVLRKPQWVTVASPAYLARSPALASLDDLANHTCLRFVPPHGRPRDWTFVEDGAVVVRPVAGNLLVDNGMVMLASAEAGMGVCQVLDYMVDDALRAGTLVEVLPRSRAPGPPIQALATAARARSANVRAFMRFLVETFA